MIKFTTTKGDVTIELDFENAPKTSANFQQYVEDGFYNGKIFHRVIDGFAGGWFFNLLGQYNGALIRRVALLATCYLLTAFASRYCLKVRLEGQWPARFLIHRANSLR